MSHSIAMRRGFYCSIVLSGLLLLMQGQTSAAADENPLGPSSSAAFAGTFSNGTLTVELSEAGGNYAGTISGGDNRFPAQATASAQGISGTYTAAGTQYAFTATLSNDQLILVSTGNTYTLKRMVINPLAAGGAPSPVNPPGPPAPPQPAPAQAPQAEMKTDAVQSLGGFIVLGGTDAGQTLFLKLPAANTLQSTITQTADELGKVLDAKPELTGAFANGKAMTRGGALLTGKLKGHDVHGWIFASLPRPGTNQAATACAIVASADAKPADIQTLIGFMPAQTHMKEYDFPDGSGSVELPEGWKTPNQTCAHGVVVVGPAGQTVAIQIRITVSTPDGNYAQIVQKNYQSKMVLYNMMMKSYQESLVRHQQFPNIPVMQEPKKPDPPDLAKAFPGTVFCRVCSGADEVLKYFYPALEKMQKDSGGGYTTVDKVIEVLPADPNPLIAKSAAGLAYLAVSAHNGDKVTAMRTVNRIDTNPIFDGKDKWIVGLNVISAPDATFDRDFPVMMDIMQSFKVNLDVTNKIYTNEGEAIRQMGEDNTKAMLQRGRDFQIQQDDNFNRFESRMQAQYKARHDSCSDFIEYASGVRTVYNTRTGESAQVDLSNVHGVVRALNDIAGDNENIEIPLRYQR